MNETPNEQQLNLEMLNEPHNTQEREQLSNLQVENLAHAFARDLLQRTYDEADLLLLRSMMVVDSYYRSVRSQELQEDEYYLKLRARLTPYKTLTIQWGTHKLVQAKDGSAKGTYKRTLANGKEAFFRNLTKPIPKGKQNKYTATAFKGVDSWLVNIALEFEDMHEILRQQSKLLTEIRSAIQKYDRLTAKFYDNLICSEEEKRKRIPAAKTADYVEIPRGDRKKTEFE